MATKSDSGAGPARTDTPQAPAIPALPSRCELDLAIEWLGNYDDSLNGAFQAKLDIELLVRARAAGVDALIAWLWRELAGAPDSVALIAVGGYGRGELHPYSDIDLMILLGRPQTTELSDAIVRFLTFLWDLKLEVGHSVRSEDEAVEAAIEDVTIATNLMESRLITGDEPLFHALNRRLAPPEVWPGREYFQAKLAEQKARHKRYHDTVYNLEPSLKGGLGGLRDIQMVSWVARRHYGAISLAELVDVGFLEEEEFRGLSDGQRFLWRVRWALHVLANRSEDRLLFDHQRELARRLGYRDGHHENLAVEQLMQDYFRNAMHIERLNERLLLAFHEDILADDAPLAVETVDPWFQIRAGFLEAVNDRVFSDRPQNLIDLFRIFQRRPDIRGVRAATIRLLRRHVELIDDEFRANPANRRAFMALLRGGGDVPGLLSRMHRYEVLDRYLPVFGLIVGRMQYDLFHVYTVDQHTLFVLRNLYRFSQRGAHDGFPMVEEIFGRLPKPELLYIAGFFHDIAKGRGGDHSELGEQDAREFCRHHELSAADTNLVCWLVQQHLVMSVTAQRQDISDPEVVNRFARSVGNLTYLDYLYLLTVADISATSPKLWNTWKANLLSELYVLAREAIQRGLENPLRRSEWIEDTRVEARRQLVAAGVDESKLEDLWATLPDEYFLRQSAPQVAWHCSEMIQADELPHVAVRRKTDRGATEIVVYADNLDGTLATIVGTLGQLDLNVVDARIFTTTDGRIVDAFQVLDQQHSEIDSEQRAMRMVQALEQNLDARPLNPPRVAQRLPRRLKHFVRRPRISFGTPPDDPRTRLELFCSDRPGLLSTVALVLLRHEVRVHGARIATFGERVEDYFLVSDHHDQPLPESLQQLIKTDLQRALSEDMPEPMADPLSSTEHAE